MRHRIELWLVLALLFAGLFAIFLPAAPAQNQSAANAASTVTPADYLKWRNEYKNWRRWGADDQRGVSNLITADKSLRAIKLVRKETVISLSHALPQQAHPEVPTSRI